MFHLTLKCRFIQLRWIRGGFKLAFLALFLSSPCWAQNTGDTTSTPVPGAGHNYLGILNETVNPANGSLSVRISTPVPPGRKLTVPFSFAYDSNGTIVLEPTATGLLWGGTSTGGVQTGWRYTVPTLTYATVKVPNVNGGLVTCEVAYNYVYTDASGGRHPLYLSIWGNTGGKIDCSTATMPDGTPVANPQVSNGGDSIVQGYTPAIPADGTFTLQKVWVADADGMVVSFTPAAGQTTVVPDSIEDRNGNAVTVNHTSPPTGFNSYTDTLGRTSVSVSGTTISVSGVSNYTANSGSVSASGLPLTIDQYSGSCPLRGGTSGSSTEVTSLTLPNSETYYFSYDSVSGNISKIVYPTGGYVRYVWGVNSKSEAGEDSGANGTTTFSCAYEYDTPVVTDRYVSFDGSTEVLHQQFSYTTTWDSDQFQYSQKTTKVITYDLVRGGNFETKYTYSGSTVEAQPSTSENITNQIPVESQIQYYDWAANGGSLLKTVNKTFQFQNENEMTCESTTLGSMTSRIDYTYLSTQQPNLYTRPMALVTDKKEWDWGTAPPCTSSSSGTPLRETITNYNSFTTPIYAGNASIFDKPSLVTVKGSGTQIAQTTYAYTTTVSPASVTVGRDSNYNANSSIARGNASSVTRWLNTGGSSPVTTYAYDDTGQVTSMIDPCGNANGTCSDMPPGSNHTTSYGYSNDNAYLATITYPNTGVAHTESFTYNNSTGEVATSTDENGKITSYSYSDPFARLTKTVYPDTGQTTLTYNDAPMSLTTPSVTTSKELSSGQYVTSVAIMDGMGHIRDSELTTDPVQADQTVTVYDGSGNPYTVTNPYRNTSDPTYGLTTYTYDPLGRTTLVKHPDGFTIQTKYGGAATQVIDEGNGTRSVQRISQTDGLGRLASVCEVTSVIQLGTTPTPAACNQNIAGTGFLTSYTYDALDDLLSVSQGGLSARTFAYNSLLELTSATNPESGLTTYTYDANGNMTSRTQPEENQTSASDTVTTSYAYDALNRMTAKQYSDDTDNVDYNYDETSPWGFTLTNQIGRLTTEYDGNTGSVFSYDPMGRVLQNHQCTPQNCGSADFPIAYTYDGIGDIVTSTDGQVNTYTRTYNDAAQLTSLVSSYSDANHPPTLFSTPTSPAYNAPGMLVSGKLGNGITETFAYNSRVRLTSESAGSVYSLSLGYAPNGDVTSTIDKINGSWTYTYDDFNRLATASGPSQPYTYAYDRFGNRWNQKLSGSCTSGSSICLTFDANNHINNGVETYDAAGNLMTDGFHNYFYDAEHHLIQVDGSDGWCASGTGTAATACYTYDADGRRVRRAVPGDGITDDFLYDLDGHFITQVSGQGSWVRGEIYAGGQHIATYENDLSTPTTFFTHADHLGTERVETGVSGASCETTTSLPFGDGLNTSGSCDPTALRFTGKQRDFETNLDNFGARYNSSSLGRFMSPDPLGGSLVDPQTLNRYSYVRNKPINMTDPTGMYECSDDQNKCQTKQDLAFEAARQNDLKSKDPNVVRAASAYGDPTKDNGVNVGFADLSKKNEGGDTTSTLGTDADGNLRANSNVVIDSSTTNAGGSALDAVVGHEGSHVANAQDVVNSITITDLAKGTFTVGQDITQYASEQRAYHVTDSILRSDNTHETFQCGTATCQLGNTVLRGQVTNIVDQILKANYRSAINNQPLTEKNPGASVVPH